MKTIRDLIQQYIDSYLHYKDTIEYPFGVDVNVQDEYAYFTIYPIGGRYIDDKGCVKYKPVRYFVKDQPYSHFLPKFELESYTMQTSYLPFLHPENKPSLMYTWYDTVISEIESSWEYRVQSAIAKVR